MNFRTEIERIRPGFEINHSDHIVMLGSCFTDSVGALLSRDGFDVIHNPLGPLYNPVSICNCLTDVQSGGQPDESTIITDADGHEHCLLYAAPKGGADIESGRMALRSALKSATIAVITLGTAIVYRWVESGMVVGNCHRFPADCFSRRMLGTDDIAGSVRSIIQSLPDTIRHIIFTVSPIRHLSDGLHGNQLSKASLLLGLDNAIAADESGRAAYFPSYEILLDDLRDYRFYGSDLKHPSDVAVDYIYEIFSCTYFNKTTLRHAAECRSKSLQAAHRPIR